MCMQNNKYRDKIISLLCSCVFIWQQFQSKWQKHTPLFLSTVCFLAVVLSCPRFSCLLLVSIIYFQFVLSLLCEPFLCESVGIHLWLPSKEACICLEEYRILKSKLPRSACQPGSWWHVVSELRHCVLLLVGKLRTSILFLFFSSILFSFLKCIFYWF